MVKVMLIDDDVPMLKYLRQLIDWEALGYEVVGQTYSSIKARAMFQELRPDIVVTDIGLPQVDGITLADEFIRLQPDVRVIFLTCHAEFHYAKRALLLEADDYLIKDELTDEQLIASLDKSKAKLLEKAGTQEQLSYREDVNRNLDVLKDTLYQQLAKGADWEATVGYARRLGIEWPYPAFMLAFGDVTYTSFFRQYGSADRDLIRFGIYNIAHDVAQKHEGITVFRAGESLVALLNYRPSLTFNEQQYLYSYAKAVRHECQQYLKVEVNFKFSANKLAPQTIASACLQMNSGKYKTFYAPLPEDGIYRHASEASSMIIPVGRLLDSSLQSLQQAASDGDREKWESSLRAVADTASSYNIDPAELIPLCARQLRLIGLKLSAQENDEAFYGCFVHALSLADLIGMMAWKLQQYEQQIRLAKEPEHTEPKLTQIDNYIYRHLAENISSIDVAEFLYMNPSYFSRYFKRLTGENFTDYVHRYKIRIAAKMLETTDEPLELVAAKFGYSDRTYFSKVFKKYNGRSPREYRVK
ncbi:two-component system response regulator YesN [Paenibacillus phyllosphaerae]|uniref:Two-component system response regulator YesN n=1 Tax=Paenibacillus phyllosphaerae TaxID=274593 RepID=A0A7W5AWQ5_9BACL|nr:response regulator [Paenibacillus phyllosphaerae]MBB3110210.1 two-component system response regulator YesN [Paenibacillus phyllosphaerae]